MKLKRVHNLIKLMGLTEDDVFRILSDFVCAHSDMDSKTLSFIISTISDGKVLKSAHRAQELTMSHQIENKLVTLLNNRTLSFSTTAKYVTLQEIAKMLGYPDKSLTVSLTISSFLDAFMVKYTGTLDKKPYTGFINGYKVYRIIDNRTSDNLNKLIKESSPDLEKLIAESSTPTA